MDENRYTDTEGGFDVRIPAGWEAEPDPEVGGVEISRAEGAGSLHLMGVPQPEGEFPDPAEELYAFLQEQGVELEEDEVDDVELEGGAELALCEYGTEADEEEGGEATFWMVGVATAPGHLVFATYSCAAGEEDEEREAVREILASLRLHGAE